MLTREITVLDPRTGETVGRVPIATSHEGERALRRARLAADGWAHTPAAERAAALHAAASAVRDAADELATLTERETGKPFDDARGGVDAGIGTLVQYAELGPVHRGRTLHGSWDATDFMVPGPRGVVAVLTPWNDPVAVAAGLLGAALVTGNTVVHKPSERCPHTGRRFAELLAAHLPEGVLEILDGDGSVGAQLAEADVDVVAHVGSSATGRAIALACARTGAKAVLENGGNDPLIVDEGVDPAWAAEQAALGAFANAGQICVSVERIYCHAALADPFLAALTAEARAWQDRLGPLVDRRQRDHVHGHVVEALAAGARALTGGEVPDGQGAYYPPTVLIGCTPQMPVMREETFGPVAPLFRFATDADAIALANDTEFGLAAYFYGRDIGRIWRVAEALEYGIVGINTGIISTEVAPFGGVKESGIGREGSKYGLEEFLEIKYLCLGGII